MTTTNGTSITRRGVIASATAGAGAAALGGSRRWRRRPRKDVRAHPRRLARRLVLAAGLRPAREARATRCSRRRSPGRRALAPHEQGHQSRHPHHRHRQRVQMGGPQGRLPGGAFLWRLAGLGRRSSRSAIASPRSSGSTPSSRRTASAASTSPPSSAARRCWRRSRRASLAAPDPRRRLSAVNEKDRAWVDSKPTPQPNGVALQPIKLTGAREKVAKKTYIRAADYPQPTFDKALAECKADKTWRTFETTNCRP